MKLQRYYTQGFKVSDDGDMCWSEDVEYLETRYEELEAKCAELEAKCAKLLEACRCRPRGHRQSGRSTAMSEWITDRRPTNEDGDAKGYVWATAKDGNVRIMGWEFAAMSNLAWMPITPPEPYVKPKRWVAEYRHGAGCWIITDNRTNLSAMGTILTDNNDEHRKAAERIADIYEEVMP